MYRLPPEETEMEFTRNMILRLAIASVVFTNAAANDDDTTIVSTETVIVSTEAASRESANAANKDAAEKAVEAVLTDTRLDLDIRLIGPTSVKIASDR